MNLDDKLRDLIASKSLSEFPLENITERSPMPDKVFVVVWNNYGDQGVDFIGVFASREAAEEAIVNREPDDVMERTNYSILEEDLRNDGSIPKRRQLCP